MGIPAHDVCVSGILPVPHGLEARGTMFMGRDANSPQETRNARPKRETSPMLRLLIITALLTMPELQAARIQLSASRAERIGRRLWQNESGGTVSGLTAWNRGEDFASLGIGHFIWYPVGVQGPFEESFPMLLDFFRANAVRVPSWLEQARDCPWQTRADFMAQFQSPRLKELRELLASTIGVQARFAARRLELALPKMLSAAPASTRAKIERNFYRVAAEPLGMYALIDYVNFKGEGTSPTERYRGEGWGLLQVLDSMGDGPPMREFSQSAARILARRVRNSPPGRGESRWLPGWRNRVQTYAE
jgi:hypothetical protein